MPRRNRRRPSNDPANFSRLLQELRDEFARSHGRLTDAERLNRRERRKQAALAREAEVRRLEQLRQSDQPLDFEDAKNLLAAYL
ncbi:hypothetical protein [Microbacterium arabinogalactanolyticum]|uniref:hypothetical protein n=1 Tax=Microbacterium arabinogalactanolyticum TaxID=69365 RepID=UPI0025570042|nr:hypothetical protein [Microbacterium arabinogalactanolyticum]GLC84503.1 hypothetical protein MIAR_10910 [Microbacterium arabinogalactanolyticum]